MVEENEAQLEKLTGGKKTRRVCQLAGTLDRIVVKHVLGIAAPMLTIESVQLMHDIKDLDPEQASRFLEFRDYADQQGFCVDDLVKVTSVLRIVPVHGTDKERASVTQQQLLDWAQEVMQTTRVAARLIAFLRPLTVKDRPLCELPDTSRVIRGAQGNRGASRSQLR